MSINFIYSCNLLLEHNILSYSFVLVMKTFLTPRSNVMYFSIIFIILLLHLFILYILCSVRQISKPHLLNNPVFLQGFVMPTLSHIPFVNTHRLISLPRFCLPVFGRVPFCHHDLIICSFLPLIFVNLNFSCKFLE